MFKGTRRILIVLLLLCSLAFNALIFVSSSIYSAVANSVEAIAGLRNPLIHSADEFSELSRTVDEQKQLNKKLRSELAETQAELLTERQLIREIRGELAETTAQVAREKAIRRQLRSDVSGVSTRVTKRVNRSAKREVAVAAGEAVPAWGIAVIAGITALELHDLCQTAKDMNELEVLFDPSLALNENELTACGFRVPTKSELASMAMSAPENAWAASREALPTLEEISEFDLPDVSLSDMREAMGSKASEVSTSVGNSASETVEKLKTWWND